MPRCRPLIVLALCGITFLTGAAWSTACLRAPRFHVAARGGAIRVGSVRPKGSAPDGTNNDASFVAIFAAVKVGPCMCLHRCRVGLHLHSVGAGGRQVTRASCVELISWMPDCLQDEHDYVDEWLQHHIGIGVGEWSRSNDAACFGRMSHWLCILFDKGGQPHTYAMDFS